MHAIGGLAIVAAIFQTLIICGIAVVLRKFSDRNSGSDMHDNLLL